MQAAYTEWITPRVKSAEEIKSEEELAKSMQAGKQTQAEREQSWVDFVTEMRADPAKLQQPLPTAPNTVDGRVYDLWQLLRQAVRGNSHYAIDTVAPIAEIAGQEDEYRQIMAEAEGEFERLDATLAALQEDEEKIQLDNRDKERQLADARQRLRESELAAGKV